MRPVFHSPSLPASKTTDSGFGVWPSWLRSVSSGGKSLLNSQSPDSDIAREPCDPSLINSAAFVIFSGHYSQGFHRACFYHQFHRYIRSPVQHGLINGIVLLPIFSLIQLSARETRGLILFTTHKKSHSDCCGFSGHIKNSQHLHHGRFLLVHEVLYRLFTFRTQISNALVRLAKGWRLIGVFSFSLHMTLDNPDKFRAAPGSNFC